MGVVDKMVHQLSNNYYQTSKYNYKITTFRLSTLAYKEYLLSEYIVFVDILVSVVLPNCIQSNFFALVVCQLWNQA